MIAIAPTTEIPNRGPSGNTATKVAYLMSRFPKLTETFVLFEMLELQRQGIDVQVFPLLRARNGQVHPEGASTFRKACELLKKPEQTAVMHREAQPFVEQARYGPLFDTSIAASQLRTMVRQPTRYLQTISTLIRRNCGSANFLLGGLAMFPKVVDFARQMQRDGVTHLHAHFANHPAAAAWIIHQLTGIPYSFTAHGADLQVDQHMLREKVAAAKFVVTISDTNREFIVNHCGKQVRDKIRVIRCGVDVNVFEPSDCAPVNRAEQPFKLVCTGTLYEVKGQTYLIDACRQLHESGIEFECHLVGDGPDRQALEEQTEQAGLQGKIRFRGKLTRPEIADLLSTVDVAVAPSVLAADGRREGIPVVLMEAMASGVPVVASDISGIPELVEDRQTGMLVSPRDSQHLAATLRTLHNDRALRQKLGRNGRDKVIRDYNLVSNTKQLATLFRGEDETC